MLGIGQKAQASNYQQQIRDMVSYINQHFIAEAPKDIYLNESQEGIGGHTKGALLKEAIESAKSKKPISENILPITTTMLALNSCIGNNTLISGDVGTGKTRLASVIGSMVYQIPVEIFDWRKIVGSPGATVNDIYATHDIAELNKGIDMAFLYLPFHMPYLIIDELNRFSELEQNRIREGVANDVWNYANHSWKIDKQVVVSAMNPDVYGGTFSLNENLVDNYSILLWPPTYNPIAHQHLVEHADEKIKEGLGLEDKVGEFFEFYKSHKNDAKAIKDKISDLQQATVQEYERRKIPIIKNGFVSEIKKEISEIRFADEPLLFFYSTLSEISQSTKFGENRFEDPRSDDEHDKRYLSTKVLRGLAGRFMKDWEMMSKGLAWYLGRDRVTVEDVKTAFVFTSAARINPEERFKQKVWNSQRSLPIRHAIAKQVIDDSFKNYTDYTSADKSFEHVRKAILMITENELNAETISEARKDLEMSDHPVARTIEEALLCMQYESMQNRK
ncbi:MAG: hypothetical protein NTV63_04785 [Candidatus Woesearchaeota archaeon]|nr:hypothetical protein [Candidatus Woesearchaeota archaeon]